jgi:transcriptional regulator with XRE-family HTH domain
MNAVKHIRTRVFKLKQAPFAEVAGVSQATVSRWESPKFSGSEPTRDEMNRIRCAAFERGLEWNDGWFFQNFPDSGAAA